MYIMDLVYSRFGVMDDSVMNQCNINYDLLIALDLHQHSFCIFVFLFQIFWESRCKF